MKLLKPTLIATFMFGLISNAFAVDFSEAYGASSMEERLRIYRNINEQINNELENNTLHYEKEYEEASPDENIIDYTLISENEENYNGYVLAKGNVKSEEIISAKSLTKEETPAKIETNTELSAENEDETGILRHLWNRLKYNTSETWNNPSTYGLMIPFYAWHNRLAYDREHIEKYNEEAWGAGLTMARYDEDDDWHALYFAAFKDSNFYLETMFGYAYQKRWWDDNHNWFVGGGLTAGFTQRHEYKYIPVPLVLPLVGAGHRNFSINMVYIPGIRNDGNVAFFFANLEF